MSKTLQAARCAGLAMLLAAAGAAQADTLRPDQQAFRALFRELVGTDTTHATGSCTLAAERMARHLGDAGYAAGEYEVFVPEGQPREGGLVARVQGSDPSLAPMLLVDHLDVVDARQEDWGGQDPFELREENGYFLGRGVIDDKALSAIWVDSLVRFRKDGVRPQRTLKVALTCGEEGQGVNGVKWLLANRPEAVSAGFAFNEGGYGTRDAAGQPIALNLAVGEKSSRSYLVEVRGPGGHSSQPTRDTPIYRLARALVAIQAYAFPPRLSDTSRMFFERTAAIVGGELGRAMQSVATDPDDASALATISDHPTHVGVLRTTCVATQLDAGHAPNALPQKATAHVQCRLLPGEDADHVQRALVEAIADPDVTVTEVRRHGDEAIVVSSPPPLTVEILGPAERIAAVHFPGTPVIPKLLTAGTDGRYLSAAGIPTYGIPGILLDRDGNGAHGIRERVGVDSVFRGRDYLYDLIRAYAGAAAP